MNLLAIECSTSLGSLALAKDGRLVGARSWWRHKSHSEFLTDSIDQMLRSCGMSCGDLNQIAVGIGPGSFTGVRVAVNCARSLAYPNNLEVHTVDSLIMLAMANLRTEGSIVCAINAFKNMVYAAVYESRNDNILEIKPPQAVRLDDFDAFKIAGASAVGDAFLQYPELSLRLKPRQVQHDFPTATTLVQSIGRYQGYVMPWKQVKPLYLRASEAEEKLKKSSN